MDTALTSEYVCELIRKDQDRLRICADVLLAGAGSEPAQPVTAAYFDDLRERVRKTARPLSKA